VKLFLVDGTPTGLRTAEIGNWTGRAAVAPRVALEELGKRSEVERTGVYLLCGPSDDFGVAVYVGEADQIWNRLTSHDAQKEFWTWVIVLVSKDENLTKAHARWLESRLVREIRLAKAVECVNRTEPEGGKLSESDLADMETFFENVKLLLPVLGLDAMPAARDGRLVGSPGVRFKLAYKNAMATCRVDGGSFVIEKGSTAIAKEVASLQPNYRKLRARLKSTKVKWTPIPGQGADLEIGAAPW